jgi:hypothetical protein
MGQPFVDQLTSWAGGLFTSVEPDRLPPNCYPYARNNALYSLSNDQAVPGKRPGMGQLHNSAEMRGPVTGQTEFLGVISGSVTRQHIVTAIEPTFGVGWVYAVDANGAITEISSSWTPTYSYPDFETASNRLYMVDGTSAKKWTGTSFQNFGIVRPIDVDWGTPADVTTGGSMPYAGEYEIALTYYNSASGVESSRSAEKTITTASDSLNTHQISLTLNTPTDTQVDKIRIYIRKTGLSTIFTQVAEVASNIGTYNINVTDEQINNQIIAAPGVDTNDPPPSGSRYIALHEGRLFVSDGIDVYYSEVNKPEAFSSRRVIAGVSRDGQTVRGLAAISGQLVIFKQDSVWAVYGSDPQTWQVRLAVSDLGCVSHRSITQVEGTTFWWSEQGPVAWAGGQPDPIGQRFIAPTIHPSEINSTSYDLICAAADHVDQKIHFAYPSTSSNRADLILTFNYRVGAWEGISDPMDVASFGVAQDGNGRPWVFLGSHSGQLFKCGRGSTDGLPSGSPHTRTFTASASTQSSITFVENDLPITSMGLVERKITVVDSLGRPISVYRARITANTTTTLTVTPAIGQLTVGSTYTVYIASPDWQIDTPWLDADVPFVKKRFSWLYLGLRVSNTATAAQVDFNRDFEINRLFVRPLYGIGASGSATWDPATWDSATWSSLQPTTPRRLRISSTGQTLKARIRNHVPTEAIAILHLGIRGEFLRDKR